MFYPYSRINMLWCGLASHPSRYNSTSFFCMVAGAQGQLLYTFARQTFINNFRLENVPTFQLDEDSFSSSREACAISAKIILKCEISTHGPMKCSKTGKRFSKRFILVPSQTNPLTVSRFESWGDIIMTVKNTNWVREMSNHTPINIQIDIHMIPFTKLGDIPLSHQNPRLPAPDSSRFDYTSDVREIFPTFRDTSTRAPNIGFPEVGTRQGSPNSTIQAGFMLSQSAGHIDLIYTNSENRPPPMGQFGPLAASTSNVPTNRTSGPLRERPAINHETPSMEDLLAAGPSGIQPHFQPMSPRSPTPSSPRRSSRLSKTTSSQTDEEGQRRRSPSPNNTKRPIYYEKPTSASKRRKLSPKKKSSSRSPPKTQSPPKSPPKKTGSPSPSRSLFDQTTQLLLTSPDRSSPGRNLGRFISMPSHDEEASILFLEERSRQASTNNRLARRQSPLVDTTQIMNATLPVIPIPNWLPNPNPPRERDLIPEHVALYVHVGTGVILRSYLFWEQHDPWQIYQAVIHNDVIIRQRTTDNNDTDVLIDSSLLRIANESIDITFQRDSEIIQVEDGISPIQLRDQAKMIAISNAESQQQMPEVPPPAEVQQQMPDLIYPLVAVLPQQMPDFPTPPSTDATAGSSTDVTQGSSSSSSTIPGSSPSSVFSLYWTSSSSGAHSNDPTNAITQGIDALMGSSDTDSSANLAETNPKATPKEGKDGGEGGGHA